MIKILQGDITQEATEAIVNAANSALAGGGGVDGAIHRVGGKVIAEECKKVIEKIKSLPTGKAVITCAGNLKVKYVIHAVGPVWKGGAANEENLLASAYVESLKLAVEHGIKTIAFPSISTGAYGYPTHLAAKVATKAVVNFLKENPNCLTEVRFILFDNFTYKVYKEALDDIIKYGNNK